MKKGLGKGLAALIGDLDDKADNQDEIIKKDNQTGQVNLPIEFLVPNRDQPRKNFSETSLNELSQSIKQKGLLKALNSLGLHLIMALKPIMNNS